MRTSTGYLRTQPVVLTKLGLPRNIMKKIDWVEVVVYIICMALAIGLTAAVILDDFIVW